MERDFTCHLVHRLLLLHVDVPRSPTNSHVVDDALGAQEAPKRVVVDDTIARPAEPGAVCGPALRFWTRLRALLLALLRRELRRVWLAVCAADSL